MFCENCNSDISISTDRCSTCGHDIGFPNVREVTKEEETKALESRYFEAITISKKGDNFNALKKFEDSINKSFAIINVNLNYLYTFITNDKELYSNYSLQIRGEIRKPAMADNDKTRRVVESLMFGNYAEKIRYAALSLDGSGLKSYGKYTLKLKEIAIKQRATLMEDNSYHFIKKHSITIDQSIPLGYRSSWQNRHKLVISKIFKKVSKKTLPEDYPNILLYSSGDRATDKFIEIHIYGAFDKNAVDSIFGKSSSDDPVEHAIIEIIKSHLNRMGIYWIEND